MEQLKSNLLKSKQHFEILDGLRGVAAICVVTFHFMEVVYSDYSQDFIGHGFLAVDFFFCLSGFVIGYAYDGRMAKMGIIEFFKSRIIRLHPLVILGSVLGLLGYFFNPFVAYHATYSAYKIALFFFCSVLLIPLPLMADRAFNLFGLNAPSWSLFWEYVANIIYALVLWRIGRKYLVALVIIAALALFYVGHHRGSLMGGWDGSSFRDGGARVAYSFLAGLLIFRCNWIIRNKLGFLGLTFLLLLAFTMPYFKWNWFAETLVVLFYFPLLIALGAGTILTVGVKKICVFSGKISYPLYMTHYFAIWIFADYLKIIKPGKTELSAVVAGGVICLLGLAYLMMTIYDIPVRKYLTAQRKTSQ